MKLTDKEIEALADEALNAACLLIQNKLEQTDGGLASLFFSGDDTLDTFKAYIRAELALKE